MHYQYNAPAADSSNVEGKNWNTIVLVLPTEAIEGWISIRFHCLDKQRTWSTCHTPYLCLPLAYQEGTDVKNRCQFSHFMPIFTSHIQ